MNNSPVKKGSFIIYLIKFIGIFSVLYFGTIGLIGLTAPGGYYSPFIDHYFNYVSWLRSSLLYGAKAVLSFAGFETYVKDIYNLQVQNGRGVHVGYDCLGYGVLSFWAAFIIANPGTFGKKTKWVVGGFLLIGCINVLRISLVLIGINKNWPAPLGLDHHGWFSIAAYSCIFTGIYFYDRSSKEQLKTPDVQP
jgi:exosortase/archaeosortase family protein